ncbi:MAG: Ldh family oxidoreductase [Verrucomicrobia bacterium]|nr:Ldh family oxidoreductase [Verrucomicrobiota bacterium]
MNPIPVSELKAFVVEVLVACGVSAEDSDVAAEVLVTTDSWGVFSHGTKSLHGYCRRLQKKGLNPRGKPKVEKEGPAWALVDGDSALAMVTGVFAMRLAIAKAQHSGIALVTVHNSCHFGAAGYYASLAAAAGQIGFAFSNDFPSVTAPGSQGPVMGSNPFAFSAPSGREGTMVLDMATAEAAGGKVSAAAAEGKSVPNTWLVDLQGRPTIDPNQFLQHKAFLAPMAGHKGYGLALMIEILSGALSGAAMREQVGKWYWEPRDISTDHSHAFIAINPAVFLGADIMPARMDELFQDIRSGPVVPGMGNVKIPGDIEREKRAKALQAGIEFPVEVLQLLQVAAEENGCAIPRFLRASG